MKNGLVFMLAFITAIETGFCQTGGNDPSKGLTIVKDREMEDDEIREFGRIIKFEDGSYPFYFVTIEFPERQMQVDFDVNVETVGVDAAHLTNLDGKYAVFYYISEIKHDLLDIIYKGQSLLGEYAPKTDPSWKTITGTLQGANHESGGDQSDTIFVTSSDGVTVAFDYYITPREVAVNGKKVTAYYSSRSVQTITYLRESKEK